MDTTTRTAAKKRGTGKHQDLAAAQDDDALLTIDTVTTLVGMGRTTVYKYIKLGTFPGPVDCGLRTHRWRARDVRRWLQSKTAPGGAAAE